MKASDITGAFDSRGALVITFLLMAVSAFYAQSCGVVGPFAGDKGLVFPSPNEWISSPSVSLWVNIAVTAAVIVLMIFINKVYNIPRTITLVYATFFTVMQTATPAVSSQFYSGTFLLAVVVSCMLLMFGSFSRPAALKQVFMVFFLLSAATAAQYAFIIYLPVFAVGCAQMRIFSFRAAIAALLGVITPWWIMFGLGIIGPDDFHTPRFLSIFSAATLRDSLILILTVLLSVVLVITAYGMSLLKLMTYNARTRACNGLLTLITAVTVIAMAVDFNNLATYIPLLNFCTAFFLSHLFVIRRSPRSRIAVISFILAYYALYLWRITA